MKNLFLVGAAVCAAVILAGCGHNAIQYGDGIGFDAGVNPENYTASFNLRYGKILSAVTRDNVEIEVTGKTDANGASGTEKSGNAAVSTDGTLKMVLLHFVKNRRLRSRNLCTVKPQSGINGSVAPAVLWTDFIPFVA